MFLWTVLPGAGMSSSLCLGLPWGTKERSFCHVTDSVVRNSDGAQQGWPVSAPKSLGHQLRRHDGGGRGDLNGSVLPSSGSFFSACLEHATRLSSISIVDLRSYRRPLHVQLGSERKSLQSKRFKRQRAKLQDSFGPASEVTRGHRHHTVHMHSEGTSIGSESCIC